MGNRELLAVVLALQAWRHWQEGAEHPLIVWTDNKILSYLCSARRLNSHQAWLALFPGRFNFTLIYRPGFRNTKPDALSRLQTSEDAATEPKTILPSSCVLAAASWKIELVVREAQCSSPDAGKGPGLFVGTVGTRFKADMSS